MIEGLSERGKKRLRKESELIERASERVKEGGSERVSEGGRERVEGDDYLVVCQCLSRLH